MQEEWDWVNGLAAALVAQIQPHLPDRVNLTVEGSGPDLMVWCNRPDHGTGFGNLACQPGRMSKSERARIAVNATVQGIQDYTARVTAEPWPGTGTTMPTLHVVGNDSLMCVYVCDPQPLASIPY